MRLQGTKRALPISVNVESRNGYAIANGIEPGEEVLSRRDRCRCSVEMDAYDVKPLRGLFQRKSGRQLSRTTQALLIPRLGDRTPHFLRQAESVFDEAPQGGACLCLWGNYIEPNCHRKLNATFLHCPKRCI